MSSRALRKLQRQREQEKQLADAAPLEDEEDEPEVVSTEALSDQPKDNAFNLLGLAEEDHASSSEDLPQPSEEEIVQASSSKQSKRSRKKKKKAKASLEAGLKVEDNQPPLPRQGSAEPLKKPDLDATDGSSQVISRDEEEKPEEGQSEGGRSGLPSTGGKKKRKNKGKKRQGVKPSPSEADENTVFGSDGPVGTMKSAAQGAEGTNLLGWKEVNMLLAADSKDLNPINEMKRLFGNVVLEAERENRGSPETGRRRGRQQQVDLGGALAGHNFAAAQGRVQPRAAAGIMLRRNIFMPGKEEWPRAPSGGLGMEMVEDIGEEVIYEFVHNAAYQDTQRQFYMCVESMDPQRMIALLQLNPYHVATLLQVSEIAKQQGDHSVAADLLERGLFTFGRSVHSTFSTKLREGLARLDFVVQENREFWLTVWRYISNLGQRGTWRTAYEWAKLLLSLDMSGDPYCISLLIDQLALRARNHDHFITLCQSAAFRTIFFETQPNLQISLSLAYFKSGKSSECRQQLQTCVRKYPWMFARLFKELNIEPIPKSIWGHQPETERDQLLCELYVRRAKDLWNSPETITLLKEAIEIEPSRIIPDPSKYRSVIHESEARHVLLLEDPALIALLPRAFRDRYGSPNDPLPPVNPFAGDSEMDSDDEDPPSSRLGIPMIAMEDDNEGEFITLGRDTSWLNRLLEFVRIRNDSTNDPDNNIDGRTPEGYLQQMLQSAQEGELEGTGTHTESINDRQATVEEDLWESDPEQPFRTSMQDDDAPVLETPEEADQRTQRFLAGRGLQGLRDFVAANGVDKGNWAADLDETPLMEYASMLLSLRKRTTRQFILNYILPQGTSLMVKEMVIRKVEGLEPGSTR